MRRLLFVLPFVLLAARHLPAQTLNTAWFGTVGGGLGAYDNVAFSQRLRSYTPVNYVGDHLVYQTQSFSNRGVTLNAGGGVLLGGWLMIGASGEQVTFPKVRSINGPGNPQDEYDLSGGGGGLDLGYAIVNEEATLVVPFAQIGYYGYSLKYQNNQDVAIPFFEGPLTAPGASTTFTGAAPRMALGIQLLRFLNGAGGSPSGLLFSARLSYGSMLNRPFWDLNGQQVFNGGHTPAFNALELTIGIGGGMGSIMAGK